MKSQMLKPLILIVAVLTITAFAGNAQSTTKTKSFSKEFVVGKDVRLNIETSFGKVHCNVWDKNLISIDVLVTASARTEKDAQQLISRITPVISGNTSLVEIRTNIENTGSSEKSKSFSIDYTINMPRSTTLKAENRFGDLFIDESTGLVNILIEYGNLTINRLSGQVSHITLKFSNGTINSVNDLELTTQYSTLKIKNASYINSGTKFSTLNLGKTGSMVIDSEYDTFQIEEIGMISGEGKFSNLNINHLDQKLDLKLDYGGLEVKSANPAFSLINLITSFNSIDIRIPSTSSYMLNADMSFGDCIFPKGSPVNVTEKSYTSKLMNGKVGISKSPISKVNIKGKNSDVKLF